MRHVVGPRKSLSERGSGGGIDIDTMVVDRAAAVGVVNRSGLVIDRSPPAADVFEITEFTLTRIDQFF